MSIVHRGVHAVRRLSGLSGAVATLTACLGLVNATPVAAQGGDCSSTPGNPNCSALTSTAGLTTADAASLSLTNDATTTRIYRLTKPATLDILFTYTLPSACSGMQVGVNRSAVGKEDRPGHMAVIPVPLTSTPMTPIAQRNGFSTGQSTASFPLGRLDAGRHIVALGVSCQIPGKSQRSQTGVRLELVADFNRATNGDFGIPIPRRP